MSYSQDTLSERNEYYEAFVYDAAMGFVYAVHRLLQMDMMSAINAVGAGSVTFRYSDALAEQTPPDGFVQIIYRNLPVLTFSIETITEVPEAPEGGEASITLSGRAVYALLDNAVIFPTDLADGETAERKFEHHTLGEIMLTLMEEAQARGWGGVMPSFTETHDSAGIPWAESFTFSHRAGETLLSIAQRHAAYGIDVTVSPNRILGYYQDLRDDKSYEIVLRYGRDLTSFSAKIDTTKMRSVLLLEGNDMFATATATGVAYHREISGRLSNMDDDSELATRAQSIIDAMAEPYIVISAKLIPFTWRPFMDLQLGDVVTVDAGARWHVQARIIAISVRWSGSVSDVALTFDNLPALPIIDMSRNIESLLMHSPLIKQGYPQPVVRRVRVQTVATAADLDALTPLLPGLMAYTRDTKEMHYYDGSAWQVV